jgi:hypothetical protein
MLPYLHRRLAALLAAFWAAVDSIGCAQDQLPDTSKPEPD